MAKKWHFSDKDFKLVVDCLQIASEGYRDQATFTLAGPEEAAELNAKADRVDELRAEMKEQL